MLREVSAASLLADITPAELIFGSAAVFVRCRSTAT